MAKEEWAYSAKMKVQRKLAVWPTTGKKSSSANGGEPRRVTCPFFQRHRSRAGQTESDRQSETNGQNGRRWKRALFAKSRGTVVD